jgi:hypothetical protein
VRRESNIALTGSKFDNTRRQESNKRNVPWQDQD